MKKDKYHENLSTNCEEFQKVLRTSCPWENTSRETISVNSASKIFALFCPFLRYFPYRKKCSKKSEILLRYWQISQKKDKKPKIFVALMNDIATRRDCDIIATLSVATISQPCGSRYTDNLEIFESKPYFSRLIKENSDTMLVISKMNMNAIWLNASVQHLTIQSSVSSNFRCWPTVLTVSHR